MMEPGHFVVTGPSSAAPNASALRLSGTTVIHAFARNKPGQVIVIALLGTAAMLSK